MEEEGIHSTGVSASSSTPNSSSQVDEEEEHRQDENHDSHRQNRSSGLSSSSSSQVLDEDEQRQDENQDSHRQHRSSGVSYRRNSLVSHDSSSINVREDLWSGLIVLLTFWFFASMTLILAFYGSENLPLGPNCSHLVQANPFFVQSIKAKEVDESTHGPILYGFYKPPPLDVEITWSETHNAFVQSSYHKEWRYFLNKGSKVHISYSVESPSSAPLSLVIAQGSEGLAEWIENPSHANTTLSWNIIHGNGIIQQDILSSQIYYIALGNLNSEGVEVQLNFTIKAIVYNTTQAYYKCSLSHRECILKLFLLMETVAIVTSPSSEQGMVNYDWYVKLSYGPRWMTYFIGSGVMSIFIILAVKIITMFQIMRGDESRFQGESGSERAPLLSQKDDDLSSWGSSCDSASHDDEEIDKLLAVASLSGKQLKEGESINDSQRLCVVCFDAPRDCFFLPCGHCVVCFTCGTRVVEEAGTCPICLRTMKKVRKIFTV